MAAESGLGWQTLRVVLMCVESVVFWSKLIESYWPNALQKVELAQEEVCLLISKALVVYARSTHPLYKSISQVQCDYILLSKEGLVRACPPASLRR